MSNLLRTSPNGLRPKIDLVQKWRSLKADLSSMQPQVSTLLNYLSGQY